MRILVVEDEMLIAWELKAILSGLGCSVVGPAARLSDALTLAKTAEMDGALLDMNLHGEPIFSVADALRERGISFAFATGYDNPEIPAEYTKTPKLMKPFDADGVERVIRDFRRLTTNPSS